MKRYAMAYTLWFIAVIATAAIILEWYRRVENTTWTKIVAGLREVTIDSDPEQ